MKKVLVVAQSMQPQFYKMIKKSLEDLADVKVICGDVDEPDVLKCPAYDKTSHKTKFLSWLKYWTFMKRWLRKSKREKYDLIFVSSNPPISIFLCLGLKKALGGSLLYAHWDIHPQGMRFAFGKHLPVKLICCLWRVWSEKNYPRFDLMLANGPMAKRYIKSQYHTRFPIAAMPFPADTELLSRIPKKENSFLAQNGIEDKFVVLYSGTMGIGHDIEIILNAAEKMKEIKDIVFLFVGSGVKASLVKEYIKNSPNENVILLPWQPRKMLPYILSAGDVGIVSQTREGSDLQYPSKVFSYMACKTPVIGIAEKNSDLYELISKEKVGMFVDSRSSDALKNAILELKKDEGLRADYGSNGIHTVKSKYSIESIAIQYREMFKRFL